MSESPERSPLEDLIARCEDASGKMRPKNPHRQLLKDLAVALVAQARLIVDLQTELRKSRRTEGGIILP